MGALKMFVSYIMRVKWRYMSPVIVGIGVIAVVTLTSSVFHPTTREHLTLKTPSHKNLLRYTHDVHSEAITLVTAYFDLGTFQKGEKKYFYSKKMYFTWTKIYKYVENPLVCYTDSKDFFNLMTELRKGKEHKTKIFLIERNSSWAFQWEPRVKEVISQPGYPKHHPNTVMPSYPCAMFAKYDVINRAIEADYFKTRYIAWTDIGHFRDRFSRRKFELVKLGSHNESRVAMSQVYKVPFDVSPKKIFFENMVWVGGAFVFGNRERMRKFTAQFKRAVDYFLSQNMTNTDQQVLYAIYSDEGRRKLKPEVEIQCSQVSDWFGLGTRMIKELSGTVRPS